jgi:SAM-dependent methyltransferase
MTPLAVELYGRGLVATAAGWSAYDVSVEYDDGSRAALPLRRWSRPLLAGDRSLLSRVDGPTLDVGCGPGRLVAAVASIGVPALGIDICAEAVRIARESGAYALRRDVFGRVPAEGRWRTVLLADGNIGIGGDPVALLTRTRTLLARRGRALVELEAPGTPTRRVRVRLRSAGELSRWFGWAHLGVDDIAPAAVAAALDLENVWKGGGRWFASLVVRS